MSFFACPDLFYFDSFLLLYLKKTKGQHGKDMPSLLYIIIFCWKGSCSRQEALGSVGKLAGQLKAEFLNGFFDFCFGHGATVFLVGANVFGGDSAI